jgi:hypothetical protein
MTKDGREIQLEETVARVRKDLKAAESIGDEPSRIEATARLKVDLAEAKAAIKTYRADQAEKPGRLADDKKLAAARARQ